MYYTSSRSLAPVGFFLTQNELWWNACRTYKIPHVVSLELVAHLMCLYHMIPEINMTFHYMKQITKWWYQPFPRNHSRAKTCGTKQFLTMCNTLNTCYPWLFRRKKWVMHYLWGISGARNAKKEVILLNRNTWHVWVCVAQSPHCLSALWREAIGPFYHNLLLNRLQMWHVMTITRLDVT